MHLSPLLHHRLCVEDNDLSHQWYLFGLSVPFEDVNSMGPRASDGTANEYRRIHESSQHTQASPGFAMTSEFGNAASDVRWHGDDPELDYASGRITVAVYRLVGRLFQEAKVHTLK